MRNKGLYKVIFKVKRSHQLPVKLDGLGCGVKDVRWHVVCDKVSVRSVLDLHHHDTCRRLHKRIIININVCSM